MILSKALIKFSGLHLNSENNWYHWREIKHGSLPEGIKLNKSDNQYYQNISLKKQLSKQYAEANPEGKIILTKYYISTWGGIHGNKTDTLKCYALSCPEELRKRREKGIASWSKALVIRDPSQYAIYDARVAFSLNLLQIVYPVGKRYLYPLLTSRNTQAGKWRQLIHSQSNGWERAGDDFYTAYLKLLSEVSGSLDYEISSLEMLLFSKVDQLFKNASQNP